MFHHVVIMNLWFPPFDENTVKEQHQNDAFLVKLITIVLTYFTSKGQDTLFYFFSQSYYNATTKYEG